ncbi:dephospho-CoA kinase [Limosilactobacillus pontis]|uniref:dephospho-CoA kinase n=1 Tax=Limosilactobacillus pontis TaxID=35787 RepID=UPI00224569B5|nr:dephospho-CoA kinase [Limosilactobacillus pontis]MCX2186761.1 dephospho-CoA kinase [Limosilactobacillus pontis]MCX2188393.1 dephospho-CoA kinase [Limosilactobacillus pontis]
MTKIIGLTGGIASGKSTVSALLRQAGIPVIDADQVARQVQRPGSVALDKLAAAFGPAIIAPDGSLNRQQLGQRVFDDPAARQELDRIVQALIKDTIWQAVDNLRRQGVANVVLDVPLLFEAGYDTDCDLVVVVRVSPATELRRLMARNGYSRAAAQARIAAQLPLSVKVAKADVVIDNDGSLEETRRQVAQLVEDLRGTR